MAEATARHGYLIEVCHTMLEDGRNGVRPYRHHVWVDAAPLRPPLTRAEAEAFIGRLRPLERHAYRIAMLQGPKPGHEGSLL